MSSTVLESGLPHAASERSAAGTLIVAWQHPRSRAISPVGLLDHDREGYRFRYIANARDVDGFLPFLGFSDLGAAYSSPWLFPMFAQRVLNPRRPDYPYWLDVLSLPEDAAPFEFMARCEGRREGDTVVVTAPPTVGPQGDLEMTFMVHGVRYALEDPRAAAAFDSLRDGDEVAFASEPDNPKDSLAVHVCAREVPLGWVPRLLCPAVHAAMADGPVVGRVLRLNGPEVPPHMRLLVELRGRVSASWDFFADPGWLPVSR